MRFARRSWGWWFVLFRRDRFKIKLLWVKRGERLSIQKHHRRSELWCFLGGRGQFLLKNEWLSISPGDYRLVPGQVVHSYHAFWDTLVIEIQFGDICVEDDIERLS